MKNENYNPAEEGIQAAREEAKRAKRIAALTEEFAHFCQDSLAEGYGDDLDDSQFIQMAMETFLELKLQE